METPKEVVRELERAPPGCRFERLYRKRQQSRHGGLKNGVFVIAGLLTIAIGVVTYPIPVIPSDILILLGLAFGAQGSLWGAKVLDGAERRFRRRFAWLIRKWKPLPRPAKLAIWIGWMSFVGGISYAVYRTIA